MTAPAAAFHVNLHGASIVVTAQAGCLSMGALQRIARFFFVIEGEICAQLVPACRNMTEAAVTGEGLVRDQGAPARIPILTGDDG